MFYLILIFFLGIVCHVDLINADSKVCNTDICKQLVLELKSSMNTSVDPCEDFSSYICGNFGKSHPIAPGSSTANAFSYIGDKVENILKDLLENQVLNDRNVPQTKAALFYRSCMDIGKRNLNSKRILLDTIKQFKRDSTYEDSLVTLILKGITSRIVAFQPESDSKNPEYFELNIGLPQLILSESTLKSPQEDDSKKQIASQIKFMKKVYGLLGMSADEESSINDVIDFNIKIAKIFPSVVDQRNPNKYYNKISIRTLQTLCHDINWLHLINGVLNGTGKSLKESDEIIVSSLSYIGGMCSVLRSYKSDQRLMKVLQNDLIWADLNSVISLGSEDLLEALNKLMEELFGITGKKELWKTCVTLTSENFVDIVGNMYVKKAFDVSKKKDIEGMLRNIRNSMKEVIENVKWMDAGTKQKALVKLATIKQKIGYADAILNETQLTMNYKNVHIGADSLIQNYYTFSKISKQISLKLIKEKISDDFWFMGPHQVNAYYNPVANEIVFPAAILQYPFYDIGLPVTSNYGGIGLVIGHEILHGFDTEGSKFDSQGILRDWWTNVTKQKYLEKTKCIENQYGNYTIYGEKLPSLQTIGEDIADNAGLRMSYLASQSSTKEKTVLPGLKFSTDQLFFVHFARTWCAHITKSALLENMKNDVHTVWSYRINGSLSNMPEFSKAFKCNHDQKMNRHKKCLVW